MRMPAIWRWRSRPSKNISFWTRMRKRHSLHSNTNVCTACSVRTNTRNHQFKCAANQYAPSSIQMCTACTVTTTVCPCNINVSINQCAISILHIILKINPKKKHIKQSHASYTGPIPPIHICLSIHATVLYISYNATAQ